VCGDVNETGSVTTSDALNVLRAAVGQDIQLACGEDCDDTEARLATLETALGLIESDLASLAEQLSDATDTITNLQALLDGVTRNESTLLFTGLNLQIRNGSGATDGLPNGLGNLIIGYNEATDE
jgi:hypothetical protein